MPMYGTVLRYGYGEKRKKRLFFSYKDGYLSDAICEVC